MSSSNSEKSEIRASSDSFLIQMGALVLHQQYQLPTSKWVTAPGGVFFFFFPRKKEAESQT